MIIGKSKFIRWLQNGCKRAENAGQIVRTLITQNNTQWVFHLSQEL